MISGRIGYNSAGIAVDLQPRQAVVSPSKFESTRPLKVFRLEQKTATEPGIKFRGMQQWSPDRHMSEAARRVEHVTRDRDVV
jgi:hypothetical protein